MPVLALTATARKKVAEDTIKILNIPNCKKFNTGTTITLSTTTHFGANSCAGSSDFGFVRRL